MSWPCWFRIVMDPKLQRGPTIPFILGACRDPFSEDASPELGESDLRRLLAAMRDETPKPYWIEILRCPDLKTYVASACIEPLDCRRSRPDLAEHLQQQARHGVAPVLPGRQPEMGQPVDLGRSESALARARS